MNLSALLTAMLVGSTINQSTATPKSISIPKNGVKPPPQSNSIGTYNNVTKWAMSLFHNEKPANKTFVASPESIGDKLGQAISKLGQAISNIGQEIECFFNNEENLKLIFVGFISGLIGFAIGNGELRVVLKQEKDYQPTPPNDCNKKCTHGYSYEDTPAKVTGDNILLIEE
jgi:hypothetical protein